jgi:hypothetical protein
MMMDFEFQPVFTALFDLALTEIADAKPSTSYLISIWTLFVGTNFVLFPRKKRSKTGVIAGRRLLTTSVRSVLE